MQHGHSIRLPSSVFYDTTTSNGHCLPNSHFWNHTKHLSKAFFFEHVKLVLRSGASCTTSSSPIIPSHADLLEPRPNKPDQNLLNRSAKTIILTFHPSLPRVNLRFMTLQCEFLIQLERCCFISRQCEGPSFFR